MSLLNASAVVVLQTVLSDPNVVFLLFVVAMFGCYLEIAHPGAIVPGLVGIISLILFLFAASALSPNWWGLPLMVLAFALMVADLHFTAHGVLTIAAVVSLIAGTLLFFHVGSAPPGKQIEPLLVYAVGSSLGLLGIALVTYLVRARRSAKTTGAEGMIGATATTMTGLHPMGRVNYAGENWEALLDHPYTELAEGVEVEIVAVEGLRLRVRPVGQRLARRRFEHQMHPNELMKEI